MRKGNAFLGITYLAPVISNPVGAKLSRWHLGIPLAPTGVYVEFVRNVDIVSLVRNYPVGTSELFPLGANLALRKNSTLCINSSASVYVTTFVEVVRYIEIVQLAQNLYIV